MIEHLKSIVSSILDPRIVLCGLSNALFRASFYIWLIEWTPTLQAAENKTIAEPLPLGFLYSSYLVGIEIQFGGNDYFFSLIAITSIRFVCFRSTD